LILPSCCHFKDFYRNLQALGSLKRKDPVVAAAEEVPEEEEVEAAAVVLDVEAI
jgi:hypothetical protein